MWPAVLLVGREALLCVEVQEGEFMPKMRTRKGAAKRLSRTARGKIKMHRPFSSHMLTKKTTKRKRHLRQSSIASPTDMPRINRMLGGR